MPNSTHESQAEYKARILSYQHGSDPLRLQAEAPDRLTSLIADAPSADLLRRPSPDKWSIQEIVAHLADDELVGAYRIRLILSASGTPIQAFDQAEWARTGRYAARPVDASLSLFRLLRQANLALLESLFPDEWDMYGLHEERGAESIRDIACYYAGHDINHFRQIEAIRRVFEESI
jgi:hypothetical protein